MVYEENKGSTEEPDILLNGWSMEVRGEKLGEWVIRGPGIWYTTIGDRVHCMVCSRWNSRDCRWERAVPRIVR